VGTFGRSGSVPNHAGEADSAPPDPLQLVGWGLSAPHQEPRPLVSGLWPRFGSLPNSLHSPIFRGLDKTLHRGTYYYAILRKISLDPNGEEDSPHLPHRGLWPKRLSRMFTIV